jgi:hypothetical protein
MITLTDISTDCGNRRAYKHHYNYYEGPLLIRTHNLAIFYAVIEKKLSMILFIETIVLTI